VDFPAPESPVNQSMTEWCPFSFSWRRRLTVSWCQTTLLFWVFKAVFFLLAIIYKVVYLPMKVFSFFCPLKHADGLWFIFCHGITRKMYSFLFLAADECFFTGTGLLRFYKQSSILG
jgi:hypothetical protein